MWSIGNMQYKQTWVHGRWSLIWINCGWKWWTNWMDWFKFNLKWSIYISGWVTSSDVSVQNKSLRILFNFVIWDTCFDTYFFRTGCSELLTEKMNAIVSKLFSRIDRRSKKIFLTLVSFRCSLIMISKNFDNLKFSLSEWRLHPVHQCCRTCRQQNHWWSWIRLHY